MKNYGWVTLSRKFFEEDPDWNKPREYSLAEAWIDTIQMAAYADHQKRVGTRTVPLARGELLLSIRFLAARWQWSSGRVSRWLSMCTNEGRLREVRSGVDGTTYLVEKYEVYQKPWDGCEDSSEYDCGVPDGDKVSRKKRTKKQPVEWKPSPEYLEASRAYHASLMGAEAEKYGPKKNEQDFYYAQWTALKKNGETPEEAHRLLAAACKGWRFDDWPDRKIAKNHTFCVVIGTLKNIYNFSLLDAKDEEENDRVIAQLELEMALDAKPDPFSN
jgi:hypothetical protein